MNWYSIFLDTAFLRSALILSVLFNIGVYATRLARSVVETTEWRGRMSEVRV
jgi:hypothetical protein